MQVLAINNSDYNHNVEKTIYKKNILSEIITKNSSQIEVDGSVLYCSKGLNIYDIKHVFTSKNKIKEYFISSHHFDNSFLILCISNNNVLIVTDSGGSIPIYYASKDKKWALGTSLNSVAKSIDCTDIDLVSTVDFMLHETVVYPYTWFSNVKVLPPGSIISIDMEGRLDIDPYWVPKESEDHESKKFVLDEWAEKLRECLKDIINNAITKSNNTRVLFSAGEDSRAVLGLIPRQHKVIPTMISDSKNREYNIAAAVAKKQGYRLDWIERPEGYYRSNISEKIRIVGPGRDIRHVHFNFEIGDKLLDSDIILGGYLADSLFKSNYMSNIHRRAFLPDNLTEPKPDAIKILDSCSGYSFFKTEMLDQVWARRMEHHNRLKEFRPNTAGNWHSLWPLSNRNTFPQYLGTLELGPRIVEPFMAHKTYILAAEMPDHGRINRAVFYRAFGKAMGKTGWEMTSSGTVPRFGHGHTNALLSGLTSRVRAVKDRIGNSRGLEMAWSPDHKGWEPINPSDYFNMTESAYLFENLKLIAVDKAVNGFFNNRNIPLKVRMRALQLAFIVK